MGPFQVINKWNIIFLDLNHKTPSLGENSTDVNSKFHNKNFYDPNYDYNEEIIDDITLY